MYNKFNCCCLLGVGDDLSFLLHSTANFPVAMVFSEYEAKERFRDAGIPVPNGVLISSPREAVSALTTLSSSVILKAQVPAACRRKAGGILPATPDTAEETAQELFSREIKGFPVAKILMEEKLSIHQSYYLSITRIRSQALLLFCVLGESGFSEYADRHPESVRRVFVDATSPELGMEDIRALCGSAPEEVCSIFQNLYHIFQEETALLVEINPLAETETGFVAVDGKVICDEEEMAQLQAFS